MLNDKSEFIISATSTPTSSEKADQRFSPKSLKVNFESLASEDSGRTNDGVMHVSFVLSRIRKIEITMPPCTVDDSSKILNLVQGKVYWITYFDPLANEEKTKQVYTGNSAAECYNGVILNGLYTGLAFNAVELGGEN